MHVRSDPGARSVTRAVATVLALLAGVSTIVAPSGLGTVGAAPAPGAPPSIPASAPGPCWSGSTEWASCDESLAQPFQALPAPMRLLDTRPGMHTADGQNQPAARVAGGTTYRLLVGPRGPSVGGLPYRPGAVALNVTAVAPTAAGYVTAYPCDGERPNASSLNYAAAQTVGNAVVVPVATDGTVCLFSYATTDLVVDASGWFAAGAGFDGLPPARLLDTRPGELTADGRLAGVGALAAGATLELPVAGRAGVPTDAAAVTLNLTVVDPAADGYVTVFPCDRPRPNASSINFAAHQTVGNAVLAPLGANGSICLFAYAATQLVVDASGSFAGATGFRGLTPARLLDTRPGMATVDGIAAGRGVAAAGSTVVVPVRGRAGVPADAVSVALNLTVVAPVGGGFVTAYPCDQPRPATSSINFAAHQTVGNAVLASLAADGTLCLYSYAATHLVVDVAGVTGLDLRLPRSDVDRPGVNAWDVKPLYITLQDGPDDHRDTDGSLATWAVSALRWYQTQFAGQTLRLDTYDGRPDVSHVTLPYTAAQMMDFSKDHEWPLLRALADAGWPTNQVTFDPNGPKYGDNERIYLVFIEGPRGWYANRTGWEEASCGNTTDVSPQGVVGLFLRANDGTRCPTSSLPPIANHQSSGWDTLRLLTQTLRAMPGCAWVLNEEFASPWETRPSVIAPASDITKPGSDADPNFTGIPELDPAHLYYFRIDHGPWTAQPCRDIVRSPYWQPRWGRGAAALERSTVDRPDDTTAEQVKVFYVLPADGEDEWWDLGRLDRVVATADRWLASQTGRTVRWDTFQGHVDVTFVRLTETAAQLQATPIPGGNCSSMPCPSNALLQIRLRELGLSSPTKAQIVLYGGTYGASWSGQACSMAGPSRTSIVYVGRRDAQGHPQCLPDLATGLPATDNSLGLVMVHELFHTLGAVPAGAPDGDGMGHIVGDPNDLMATYPRDGFTAFTLDVHRRDYFGHGVAGRTDLATSVFLRPTVPEGATYPPRWNAGP